MAIGKTFIGERWRENAEGKLYKRMRRLLLGRYQQKQTSNKTATGIQRHPLPVHRHRIHSAQWGGAVAGDERSRVADAKRRTFKGRGRGNKGDLPRVSRQGAQGELSLPCCGAGSRLGTLMHAWHSACKDSMLKRRASASSSLPEAWLGPDTWLRACPSCGEADLSASMSSGDWGVKDRVGHCARGRLAHISPAASVGALCSP